MQRAAPLIMTCALASGLGVHSLAPPTRGPLLRRTPPTAVVSGGGAVDSSPNVLSRRACLTGVVASAVASAIATPPAAYADDDAPVDL